MFSALYNVKPVRQMAAMTLWSHQIFDNEFLDQFEQRRIVKLYKDKYVKSVVRTFCSLNLYKLHLSRAKHRL